MEHKLEERHQEINDPGHQLSADGLTLLIVTNAALDENDHFTIPDGVTSIGKWAFNNCTSLTTVHIPNSVTSIGDTAFYGCTSLTTAHIPEGVTSIGDTAFYSCTSLTTAHISEGVTSIGGYAFHNCTSLTTVHIPGSVTSIGNWTFAGCTSLTHIIIDTDDKAKLNRIKNLLPKNQRDKVISRSVYEIQRKMVDVYSFAAAGGACLDNTLWSLGLRVTAVNQIIASYLPQAFDRILGIIKKVGIPTCLPNDESKITYCELLAQSIGRVFPNFNAAQANDQKQADTARLLTHEKDHEVETQDVIHDHHADEKQSPAQDQQGSTPVPASAPALFQSVPRTPGTTQAASQTVVPTRGQRDEEQTDSSCVARCAIL